MSRDEWAGKVAEVEPTFPVVPVVRPKLGHLLQAARCGAGGGRMSVVDVKVVVLENGEEVETLSVGYFVGQEYAVKIDTADGTDRIYEGTVPAHGFA